ncbi:YDG/SRA domain-containing protein [Aliarcobacter butzleri]|uniref:YDG/SRA domain-containing protein n=1 Tax=Aliarcobacter butzleri TaxID=28197 RepID=UPI003B20C4C5
MSKNYKNIAKQMVQDYLELEELTESNKRGIPNTKLGQKYEIDTSAAGELWRGVRMGMLQQYDSKTIYGLAVKQMHDDNVVDRINKLTYKELGEIYNIDGTAAMNILIGLDAAKKNGKDRVFGNILGIAPGQIFVDRAELAQAKVHKPTQAGISGSEKEGSDSIVLSGGYEDDQDYGDVIIYTGAGGNENGKQVRDQELKGVNLALAKSKLDELPIRVVRGYTHKSPFSPKTGYEYAGLFKVVDYWSEVGKSGFIVWRFRLEKIYKDYIETKEVFLDDNLGNEQTERVSVTTNRIKRDYKLAVKIKEIYDYKCQVCGITLNTSAGQYIEAAHIKPLGSPHNGPDKANNIICLCPNHHVLFDNGGFTINDDLTLNNIEGILTVNTNKHQLDMEYIKYHREHYSK